MDDNNKEIPEVNQNNNDFSQEESKTFEEPPGVGFATRPTEKYFAKAIFTGDEEF